METSSSRVCPCYQSEKKKRSCHPKRTWKRWRHCPAAAATQIGRELYKFQLTYILFLLVSLSDTGKSRKWRRKKIENEIAHQRLRQQRPAITASTSRQERFVFSCFSIFFFFYALFFQQRNIITTKSKEDFFSILIHWTSLFYFFWPNSWRQKIISDTTSHLFFWVNSKFPDAISWRLIHCSRKGRSRHASRYFFKMVILCMCAAVGVVSTFRMITQSDDETLWASGQI